MKGIINESRKVVLSNVNTIMIEAYWEIGKRIVEEEQKGGVRAEYGKNLLKEISRELTNEFGKGFSKSNIFSIRKFYLEYPIFQTLSGKLSWLHYQVSIIMLIKFFIIKYYILIY